MSGVEGKTKKEIETKADRLIRKWLDMPLQYRRPMVSTNTDSQAGVEK